MIENNPLIEKRIFKVIICAVLFGCDSSLVGLDLDNGIKISRKSLTLKDHLNDIFETDSMSLRRDYENARLDIETLDVACIYKEDEYYGSNKSAHTYFDELSTGLYTHLDNQVRAIRLLLEGPVRYKKLAIKVSSGSFILGETCMSCNYSGIYPIGEAYGVHTIQKAHCDDLGELRYQMDKMTFPITIEYLNQSHILYDRSYLVSLQEAEVLLITSLEILYLKSESNKKERLSKRCAIFLFDSKEERLMCYRKLCEEYKNRSDFVHDGNMKKITESGVLFLRECVRNSLMKLLSYPKDKNELVKDLRKEIEMLDYWSQ